MTSALSQPRRNARAAFCGMAMIASARRSDSSRPATASSRKTSSRRMRLWTGRSASASGGKAAIIAASTEAIQASIPFSRGVRLVAQRATESRVMDLWKVPAKSGATLARAL